MRPYDEVTLSSRIPLQEIRVSGYRLLLIALLLPCGSQADHAWFSGTQRAFPVALADPMETGLRSQWALTENGDQLWDLTLGTDVTVWQQSTPAVFQTISGRFGVDTRFQFNSASFDLWGTDLRGGLAWGVSYEPIAVDAYFFHESSHLGDEKLARNERQRRDISLNGLRLLASYQRPDQWWRVYGGLSIVPWATPDQRESLGFILGAEAIQLPPWERGFLAWHTEVWEWNAWDPAATLQIGLFLASKSEKRLLSRARVYLELYYGPVGIGQYAEETEKRLALGLGTSW